jgi:dTDP-glucose 4,6-dehydratase
MKNILVTGVAGFIGSNFIRYILQVEPDLQIVNLDALTYAGSLENLKELHNSTRHKFVQGDICNQRLVADLLRQHKIDSTFQIHY